MSPEVKRLHPDVLKRVVAEAHALEYWRGRSKFVADRYTGNVLERLHIITPQLTKQGLRELGFIIPVEVEAFKFIEHISQNPGVRQLLEPAMLLTERLLGEPRPKTWQEAARDFRRIRQSLNDCLVLNREVLLPDSRISIIGANGTITQP